MSMRNNSPNSNADSSLDNHSGAIERFYYEEDSPVPNVALHPGVSAVIFDAQQRVLIMKRPRGGFWCLPGGRMELNESAQECCIRETWEETGLRTQIIRLISVNTNPRSVVHYPDGNIHQSFVLCFEAHILEGTLQSSSESETFHWLHQSEISNFDLIPDSRLNILDAWAYQEAAFIR